MQRIISKLNNSVEEAHKEDGTFGGKFTVFIDSAPSTTAAAAAADPQAVVGLCARGREPDWLQGGRRDPLVSAPHPPGSQALRLLSRLGCHVFYTFISAFECSDPLKAYLVVG